MNIKDDQKIGLYENTYKNPQHFSFGKNWQSFLKGLNKKSVEEAKISLIKFLDGKENITGKTFIDIGCGSGLFSLAAYKLGAKKVVSVDVDDFSINCATLLRNHEGAPENWDTYKGSALDSEFLTSLGTYDIVYSWGVLHHTGNMHKAIKNVISLLNPNGKLYIAIYNDNQRILEGTSKFWLQMKKVYNNSPWIIKVITQILYASYYILGLLINGKNPVAYITNYQSLRGMNFFTDIKDWLGGYPYEFATPEAIISYCQSLGLKYIKGTTARSIGCNEFLFTKEL